MQKVGKTIKAICELAEREGEVTTRTLMDQLNMNYDKARQYISRAVSYGMLVWVSGAGTQLKSYRVVDQWRVRITVYRYELWKLLSKKGMTVMQISAELEMSPKMVRGQLARLREDGVIEMVGTHIYENKKRAPIWGVKAKAKIGRHASSGLGMWAGLL